MNIKIAMAAVLLFGVLIFSSCASTQQGIGINNSEFSQQSEVDSNSIDKDKQEDGLKVLSLTYKEAMDIAYEIVTEVFPDSEINYLANFSTITFIHYSFWGGDVRMKIEANVVKNIDNPDEYGIIYKVESKGVGSNASLTPGYAPPKFFAGLKSYLEDHDIEPLTFKKHKILKDKGLVSMISASIPTTYVGFKKYIDDKHDRKPFEGIWSTQEGKYTLGIVYTKKDPRYKYKAFIIESKTPQWKPGEIKAKFIKLRNNKLSTGVLYLQSKAELGVTWKVGKEFLELVGVPANSVVLLIKQYPESSYDYSDEFVSGAGSGWVISEKGIVITNAHVIEGADKIYVGFKKENPRQARVLITDKRIDLAVIQIITPEKKYVPIPIKPGVVENGTKIITVGYPLVFDLGDDPRVNEGIISSQSGFGKDVTRYQISASINKGNSGGPVFGPSGNAIGVVVEKLTEGEGINFAIKSGYVRSLLNQIGVDTVDENIGNDMMATEIFKKYKSSVLPVWTE